MPLPFGSAITLYLNQTGVVWDNNRWKAQINVNGRSLYLGVFTDEEEAAKAYDLAASAAYANPILNFLPDGSLNPDRRRKMGQYKCV